MSRNIKVELFSLWLFNAKININFQAQAVHLSYNKPLPWCSVKIKSGRFFVSMLKIAAENMRKSWYSVAIFLWAVFETALYPRFRDSEIYSYLRLAIFPVSCYTKGYAGECSRIFGAAPGHQKRSFIIPYLIEKCKWACSDAGQVIFFRKSPGVPCAEPDIVS